MPSVPMIPGGESSIGQSALADPGSGSSPSQAQLLMAAASMHQAGRLTDPQLSSPSGPRRQPNPQKPKHGKLKVIK